MNRFIKQSILFLFLTLLILFSMYFTSNRIVKSKTNFKIPQNVDMIVLGHSHSAVAYNDSIIKNLLNISKEGESYFFNYYKLIPIINENSNVKVVFVEFTNDQIMIKMNDWIWGETILPYEYGLLGPFIDLEGLELLISNNAIAFINGCIQSIKHNIKIISTSNYSFFNERGGYKKLYGTLNSKKLGVSDNLANKIYNKKEEISETNLFYLQKIITFCKSKNLKIYLVRSPLFNNSKIVQSDIQFKNILKSRFNSVEFLDFKNKRLIDSDFVDIGHLNYKGSNKFSLWFNNLIEQGLLIQNNKQQIIDKNN